MLPSQIYKCIFLSTEYMLHTMYLTKRMTGKGLLAILCEGLHSSLSVSLHSSLDYP